MYLCRLGILLLLCVTLNSCLWSESRNTHVFIFAVDKLDFESINCLREPLPLSGFDQICENSVRFTNTYTTSILSTGAIASLMSGLYPFEHKVHHSMDSLVPEINTHAKEALRKGYKTFFYGSSPEVMSKNGLNQGFNSFDDNLSKNKLYRSLDENLKTLKKDLVHEKSENSYHLIHVSDLSRDLNQLDNLDLALGDFFKHLKENNLWSNSVILVIGLQGKILKQADIQDSVSLFKKNATRVSFLFKSKQKNADQRLKWQIDKTINLADVGLTLIDFFEGTDKNENIKKQVTNEVFKKFQSSISLKNVISENQDLDFNNRAFLVENFWQHLQIKKNNFSVLHNLSIPAYSIRNESQLLVLEKGKEQLFNSLMDPMETTSTPITENVTELVNDLQSIEALSRATLKVDFEIVANNNFTKKIANCKSFESIRTMLETKDLYKVSAKMDFVIDRYQTVFSFEPLEKLDTQLNHVLDFNYAIKEEKLCFEHYLNLPQYNSLKLQLSYPKR